MTDPSTRHTLPAQVNALLGREQEVETLRELLDAQRTRMVTITGPGGVGKTSLAVQVAHTLGAAFRDGVHFISLAPISEPTLLLPTLAEYLGVVESPLRLLFDSIKEFLAARQTLLLLDNFEQIVSAAPMLSEFLGVAPQLQLLVTSREALRLRGEREFPLSPLGVAAQPGAGHLSQSPAVALFVERVRAVQPEFQLTEQNTAVVAEICTRLDGLPLALELAAARARLLPPEAMLIQLKESSLQLLRRGHRDLPERQQTLRRAIRWSFDLLDGAEQRTFCWASVFVGGCTLEAAQAVIGPSAALDVVDSLVSKSLVRQTATAGLPRLTLLETLREFGLEQLSDRGELEAARRAHAGYYLAFAERAEAELDGADQKSWLARLEQEQDNLRAALRWSIEGKDTEVARRLAGALQPFWFARGYWSEGRRWLEDALAIEATDAGSLAVHAKALYAAGKLARFQGDLPRARSLCEQSLAHYRTLRDQKGVLLALVQLCRMATSQGDRTAKETFLAEAIALIGALPDSIAKANAYTDIVITHMSSGAYSPEDAVYLAESERIQRTSRNEAGVAFALIHQGNLALWQGDRKLAAARFESAERLASGLGDDRLMSRLIASRVMLNVAEGDFSAARRRLLPVLQQAIRRGDHQTPIAFFALAVILHGQGLYTWSARLLGLAAATKRTRPRDDVLGTYERVLGVDEVRAALRTRLGDDAFAREMAAGQALKPDDLWNIPQPPAPAGEALPATRRESLTPREAEVLDLLAGGLSNPQIAAQLVISRRTVDAHLRSIYDKLDVKSRDAALQVARAQGLLPE